MEQYHCYTCDRSISLLFDRETQCLTQIAFGSMFASKGSTCLCDDDIVCFKLTSNIKTLKKSQHDELILKVRCSIIFLYFYNSGMVLKITTYKYWFGCYLKHKLQMVHYCSNVYFHSIIFPVSTISLVDNDVSEEGEAI